VTRQKQVGAFEGRQGCFGNFSDARQKDAYRKSPRYPDLLDEGWAWDGAMALIEPPEPASPNGSPKSFCALKNAPRGGTDHMPKRRQSWRSEGDQ